MISKREWIILAFLLAASRAAFWETPAALGDLSSTTRVVFSRSGSNSPYTSTWNGSSWSSVSSMSSVGGNAHWVVLRNCPTRNEMGCATYDGNDDVNVMFHNGSSWSSPVEVCINSAEKEDRSYDLAYEQSSGDCLIVYFDADEMNFGYRTYSGSSLSSETDLSYSNLVDGEIVALFPKPNSDQIMMVVSVITSSADPAISTNLWNGSSWGGWSTHETAGTTNDDDCFDFAWEGTSGDGLLVYGENGSSSPRYRTWNGSSWSSEASLPSTGGAPWWVKLAADPASDKIIFGGLDSGSDLNVNVWSGSSWGTNQEFESDTGTYDRRVFDIAFEPGGTKALLVFGENGYTTLRYQTWNGSSWSSELTGTDLGAQPQVVQLRTGRNTGEIYIAAADAQDDIELVRWTGSSMTSSTRIEDTRGGIAAVEQFMIAPPAGPSVVPANVPYFTDFQSGVGAEWTIKTTDYDPDFSTFLGRFSAGSTQLYLNTTVGATYTVTLDLYAIDSWNPSAGSTAVDFFRITAGSTEIFRETFSQRLDTYPPTYPNPADQTGELAFGTGTAYADGIYRNVTVTFVATSTVSTLTFADGLDQAIDDESMGLDNVRVALSTYHDVSVAKSFNVSTSSDLTYASGLNWADMDGDGDLDAIITGDTAKRMMNTSAGSSFSSSTFGTGNERRQGALVDIEHDGDVDFWSGNRNSYDVETCYRNNGSASFSDVGNLGFSGPSNNEGVAAADVNRDGWCDIVHCSENGNWIGHHQGDPSGSLPSLVGTKSSSYGLNDSGDTGNGDYMSSGDINNDGYPDFFFHWNNGKLFISDGDGTYTENPRGISVFTGLNDKFGSAWGDYDNDGDLDLFAPRYAVNNTGYLWRNDVTWTPSVSGSFSNRTTNAYVSDTSGQFACAWGDYDNDGDLDLYIATLSGPNKLYQNFGDGTFRLVDIGAGVTGSCQDVVFVDYDNDGDLDIAVTREDDTAVLLENRTNNTNYLKVRVIGRGGGATNLAGVGVRIELWNQAGTVRLGRRDIGAARGLGTEPLWAHFGGVNPATTYTLKLWLHSRDNASPLEVSVVPQNVSTTIGGVTIPQMITVTEPASSKKILLWAEVRN